MIILFIVPIEIAAPKHAIFPLKVEFSTLSVILTDSMLIAAPEKAALFEKIHEETNAFCPRRDNAVPGCKDNRFFVSTLNHLFPIILFSIK